MIKCYDTSSAYHNTKCSEDIILLIRGKGYDIQSKNHNSNNSNRSKVGAAN